MTTDSLNECIPYTQESITAFMKTLFLEDGEDVDRYVEQRFEKFKQLGRRLPPNIRLSTLKTSWSKSYKNRGRTDVRFDRGRVFKNEKGMG